MRLRRATTDDADEMAVVLAVVAQEDVLATEPPVDLGARAARFREDLAGDGPGAHWILEDADGRHLGNAGAHATAVDGVLSLGIALLPEARGRGGGRALLEAIVEHARASGAHKLELEVWPDNAPAIALYEKAGFVVEGLRRDHYRRRDGSLRSVVLMALLLADGPPG